MTELSSHVLFTGHIEQARLFYRTVGLSLDDEDHGDGPVHYATEISGVHFGAFDAKPASGRALRWRDAGSSFTGFYVASLDDTIAALTAQGLPCSPRTRCGTGDAVSSSRTRTAAPSRSTSTVTAPGSEFRSRGGA
jgi:Glyoxalase/Bleomycin resistance protein/Dioxygenase superfamily